MNAVAAGPALSRFARLARKELTEILRDRRTVLTLLLMPILLYPLLSVAFHQFLLSSAVASQEPVYRIGFRSDDEMQSVSRYLEIGAASLQLRGVFLDSKSTPRPDAIPRPKTEAAVFEDLEAALKAGRIDVGIRYDPPGKFRANPGDDRHPGENLEVNLELVYRKDTDPGLTAAHYVERLIREANTQFLTQRLRSIGIDQRAQPIRPTLVVLPGPEARSRVFAVLVPLILILMTITGAVYPAIDLTAGERERGTLEVLIAAPVPRWMLLGAKYIAVLTVAVLTALVNLASMAVTLWVSGLGQVFIDVNTLSIWLLPEIFGLLLLLAAFYSGVLLAITSFARSFKEAQAYLIPLMLASLMPGMIGLVPGLSLDGPLAVMPLINIVLLARDLLEGGASPFSAAAVVLTTVLYAIAAIAIASRTFGAEAVLYAQEGGWSELFSRTHSPRPAATASGALLCLAFLFPLSLVLNRVIVEYRDEPVTTVLFVQALSTIALFGLIPWLVVRYSRVRPLEGFRLAMPGIGACCAAVLLGLCLWPLAYELGLLLRFLGFASLSQEQLDKVEGMLGEYRTAPMPFVLLVLGVLPAVLEELFFRGYLFSALLRAGRPETAILTSALLFGLFHLVTGGGLAVERLPVSTALGLVLGWLCWKSGSVIPGMTLHAVHNSLLVSLGIYQPWLKEKGWAIAADDSLPLGVLVIGLLGSSLGLLWVHILPTAQVMTDLGDEK
jgi:ABC-2 type transport system permease protein/sodium transport system permease protein